ncbi:hypothetical protein EJB05_45216 [Eragrostis curvula]|uniref:Uncharacterized protein n=1 Tax=Eragrostis curvula TaxID=38414 RepID=A0A5J9TLS4_9POAL|nr:hypothetical protein EJB05_45216 [Eragrostis curvula]
MTWATPRVPKYFSKQWNPFLTTTGRARKHPRRRQATVAKMLGACALLRRAPTPPLVPAAPRVEFHPACPPPAPVAVKPSHQAATGFTSHQADVKRQLTSTAAGPNVLRQLRCLLLDMCVLFHLDGHRSTSAAAVSSSPLLSTSFSGLPMQDSDGAVTWKKQRSRIEGGIVGHKQHNNKSTDTSVFLNERQTPVLQLADA